MSGQSDEPRDEILIYENANGDRWYLGHDPASVTRAIKHVANPHSGGHVSFLGIGSFLSAGEGPEQQALKRWMESECLATILIAYDIHPAKGEAYDKLVNAIKSMGRWWHHLETVWIVRSSERPEAIRDKLQGLIGSDDQLLVIDITGDKAGWAGVSDAGSLWLQENSLS